MPDFQAAKTGKLISIVNVTFMDGVVKTIQVDSSTTARDVCAHLAEKVQLIDRFGLVLSIQLDNPVAITPDFRCLSQWATRLLLSELGMISCLTRSVNTNKKPG